MSSWLVPVLAVVLSYAAITSSFSIHSNDFQKCYPACIDVSTVTMLLNSDDSSSSSSRDVFRVIAPDNIASLFGSASSAARNSKPSSLNKPANASAVSDSRSDIAIDDDEEEDLPFEIGIPQFMRNEFDVELLSSGSDSAVDAAELNNLMPTSVADDLADEEVTTSGDLDEGDYGDLSGSLDTVSALLVNPFSALTERHT